MRLIVVLLGSGGNHRGTEATEGHGAPPLLHQKRHHEGTKATKNTKKKTGKCYGLRCYLAIGALRGLRAFVVNLCGWCGRAPLLPSKTVGVLLTLLGSLVRVLETRTRKEQSAAFSAFICG